MILIGCAVNPGGAFSGVESTVSGASGKRVKWMRGKADAAEAEKTGQAILRKPLTADTAAQIALLNNRAPRRDLRRSEFPTPIMFRRACQRSGRLSRRRGTVGIFRSGSHLVRIARRE